MQQTWIKKTLSVLLALALVVGVCGMFPAGAKAAINEYQLTADKTTVTEGGTVNFTVETATGVTKHTKTAVKYVWSPANDANAANQNTGKKTAEYTFNTVGQQTVTCALYDSTDAQATPFQTVTATVTVNAKAEEPKAEQPKAEQPKAEEPKAEVPQAEVPKAVGVPIQAGDLAGNGGYVIQGAIGHTVTFTNWKSSFTSQELASGHTIGLSVIDGNQNAALGDVVSATWSLSTSGIVNISGSKTGANLTLGTLGMGGPVTVTAVVVINVTGGGTETKTVSETITEVKPVINFTTASSDMEVGSTRTVSVTKYPANAEIIFESDDLATVSVSPTVATTAASATLTANALKSGATKITAFFKDYDKTAVKAEYNVPNVTGKAPTLNWKQSTMSLTAGGSIALKDQLNVTAGLMPTFAIVEGTIGTIDPATGVLSTIVGNTGTIKVEARTPATSVYKEGGPVYMYVYVGTNITITANPTTITLNPAGAQGSVWITKGAGAGTWSITSSNESVARANARDTNDATYLDIQSYTTGTAVITVRAANSTASATVYVTVGTPATAIDVNFWSSDNSTTTLNKTYNWGTLQVSVPNYNPAQPYVTVTRSNIRTYVQSGSYTSHPSTYNYTAYLYPSSSNPTTGVATLYVIPQYNGDTTYTASYTAFTGGGTVTKKSPTIHVTGYSTLPQTGADYTWAYVLGGLCLAAVATAVTLNVKRKKKQEN